MAPMSAVGEANLSPIFGYNVHTQFRNMGVALCHIIALYTLFSSRPTQDIFKADAVE